MVYLPYIVGGNSSARHLIIINTMLAQIGSAASSFITAFIINGTLSAEDMMLVSLIGSITLSLYSHILYVPIISVLSGAISGAVFVLLTNSSFIKNLSAD